MTGASVLIVEDDWIVADTIVRQVDAIGCWSVGPVASVAEAIDAMNSASPDIGLLDVNLGRETSFPIADALADRNIPFAFITGHDRSRLPERHARRPLLDKPVALSALRDQVLAFAARIGAQAGASAEGRAISRVTATAGRRHR